MNAEGLVVWVNGRLREPTEPVLSALDHGVTVGDGVFETCGVVDGQAFALTRHLRRLRQSALGIGLPEPDEAELRAAVAEVLAAGTGLGRVRITITAGLGPLGSGRLDGAPTVLVTAGPAGPPDVVRVARVPWVRNERSAVAGLKTISYAENVVALARAKAEGADEALLANSVGELCEGTGTNVFVERDGEVLTPALTSGCLGGITRELVLEWGAQAGLPVREARPGELPYTVLDDVVAGRAHLGLTGSVRTVAPVVAVDGHEVPIGRLIEELRAVYAAREPQDIDP